MSEKRGREIAETVDILAAQYKKHCDDASSVVEKRDIALFTAYVMGNLYSTVTADVATGFEAPRRPPRRDQRNIGILSSDNNNTPDVSGYAKNRLGRLTGNTTCAGTYWRSQAQLDMLKDGKLTINPGTKKVLYNTYLRRMTCTNKSGKNKGPLLSNSDTERPYLCASCKTSYVLDKERGLVV